MGELIFDSKDGHNCRREAEFLALSPAERVQAFLRSFDEWTNFKTVVEPKDKGNFVIEKRK